MSDDNDTRKPRVTVNVGPKGGIEYRLWDTGTPGCYRRITKYQAIPYMDDAARASEAALMAERKARREREAEAADWDFALRRMGAARCNTRRGSLG